MPELYPIQYNVFTGLFERLGITNLPKVPMWWLSDVVTPVAIVDSNATVQTTFNEPEGSFATAGIQNGPTAATMLADTGALPAGLYRFKVWWSFADTGKYNEIHLEHRNNLNSANIWNTQLSCPQNHQANAWLEFIIRLATDERLRAHPNVNASAGVNYSTIIFRQFLSA